MTVYVLLMGDGNVHSVWSSPYKLLMHLHTHAPAALNEHTWRIVAATIDRWSHPTHDTVDYVRSALGSES